MCKVMFFLSKTARERYASFIFMLILISLFVYLYGIGNIITVSLVASFVKRFSCTLAIYFHRNASIRIISMFSRHLCVCVYFVALRDDVEQHNTVKTIIISVCLFVYLNIDYYYKYIALMWIQTMKTHINTTSHLFIEPNANDRRMSILDNFHCCYCSVYIIYTICMFNRYTFWLEWFLDQSKSY